MSSSIVTGSKDIDLKQKFQIVERAVFPHSRVDLEVIQPNLARTLGSWMGDMQHINLFNTIFLSQGDTKGVFHAHNYDAFATFANVGVDTTIIMARPECYGVLRGTVRKAKATVVNFFGWREEGELEKQQSSLVYKVENGDFVHFPAGWFHRVDHTGVYLNVGHSFFYHELLEARVARLKAVITNKDDAEYYEKWTRRMPWWWYIAPVQFFYELARDASLANPWTSVSVAFVAVAATLFWWNRRSGSAKSVTRSKKISKKRGSA